MANEWSEFSVEELKSPVPNALATGPFGSAISSRFFAESGTPVIRGSNLSQDVGVRLIDDDLVFVDDNKKKEFARSIARRGDLVFTCWGTIDQVGLIDKRSRYEEYIVSNKQMKFTPDKEKADSLFLYYLLSSPQMRDKIVGEGIGSSVPGFNLGQLRALRLRIPPLPMQHAITAILGTLDDKIELNRQVNETLECMVRALFKSWFVDFDPVHAKAEGRDPKLPKHLADIFPDSLAESELGKIPTTWSVTMLGDLIELAYGKALKEENRRPGDIAVYGSNGQVGWHNEKLASAPGIIVGRKGNPGVVTWASTDFFAIDTTFYVVPKAKCKSLYFLYYALRAHDLASLGADSAVPGLNRNMVYMSQQLVPSTPVLDAFDHRVRPIFERIQKGDEQSSSLSALRDTLLPKLISGELRLPDAERIVGGQM